MLAVVMALVPAAAYAVTTKTVKSQSFTTSTKTIKKKATSINKRGTYKVTFKSGQGYIKFKAPATKTYTFTISNVKCSKFSSSAYWYIQTIDEKYPKNSLTNILKTNGGKASAFWNGVNGYSSSTGEKKYQNLKSRFAKIKLVKNQFAFLYLNDVSGKATANLKIS